MDNVVSLDEYRERKRQKEMDEALWEAAEQFGVKRTGPMTLSSWLNQRLIDSGMLHREP